MRTTGSLLFFRVVALGVMIFAFLHVVADVFNAYVDITEGQPFWMGRGLTDLPRLLSLPILFFAMGAILYVLVEIAARLGRLSANGIDKEYREN